jgi:hypothetical protein
MTANNQSCPQSHQKPAAVEIFLYRRRAPFPDRPCGPEPYKFINTKSLRSWVLLKYVVVAVLSSTSVLKLLSAFARSDVLSRAHPLLGCLSNWEFMVLGSVFEMCIAVYLTVETRYLRIMSCILWVSSIFLTYHVSMWTIGYKGECGCLGNLPVWLGATQRGATLLPFVISSCMFLLGSVGLVRGLCSTASKTGEELQ